jgi:hypothetical protein
MFCRTFPHHDFFTDGQGIGQENLFNVLKAYSLYVSNSRVDNYQLTEFKDMIRKSDIAKASRLWWQSYFSMYANPNSSLIQLTTEIDAGRGSLFSASAADARI